MKLSQLISLSFALATPLGACGASGGGNERTAVPTGSWGGEHVAVEVTASDATLQFDCAHGQIPSRLTVDSEGRFEVEGIFVRERGGPTGGGPQDSHPAVYSGRLEDQQLTLELRLTDDGTKAGPFTLRLGAPPQLFRCL